MLPASPAFAMYATVWLARQAGRVRPTTYAHYDFLIGRYLASIAAVPLAALDRPRLHAWLADLEERGLSDRTIRHVAVLLAIVLADAVEAGALASNPAHNLCHGRIKRRHPCVVLTAIQCHALLDAAKVMARRTAPIFWLCAHAGLRIGEARALRTEDIDLDSRTVRVARTAWQIRRPPGWGPTKSGQERTVDMSSALVQAIRPVIEERRGWLFPGRDGEPRTYDAIEATLKRVAVAVGVPHTITCHALRRSYGSMLVSAGVSIEYVRRQLGHSNIGVTIKDYSSFLPFPRPEILDRL